MLSGGERVRNHFRAAVVLLMISGSIAAQEKVIELDFAEPPVSTSDMSRTLQSLVEVQGTGGSCQNGLYLLTHFGDREELFQEENQKLIENPLAKQTWRYCSVFSKPLYLRSEGMDHHEITYCSGIAESIVEAI